MPKTLATPTAYNMSAPLAPFSCEGCRDSKAKCEYFPEETRRDGASTTGSLDNSNVGMEIDTANGTDGTQGHISDITKLESQSIPGFYGSPRAIMSWCELPSIRADKMAYDATEVETVSCEVSTTIGDEEALRHTSNLKQRSSSRADQNDLYHAIAAHNELIFTALLYPMTTKELSCDLPNTGTFLSWALLCRCPNDMLLRLIDIQEVLFSRHQSNLCLVLLSGLAESAKINFLKSWIEKGYPLNQKLCQSDREEIPLIVAHRQGNREAVRLLCEAGAQEEAKVQYGLPPLTPADEYLISAIQSRNYDGVKAACEAGANVHALLISPCGCPKRRLDCTTSQGHNTNREVAPNITHLATEHSDEEDINLLLLQHGAGPETFFPLDTDVLDLQMFAPTVLHEAAKLGKLATIQYVCENHIVGVDDLDAEGSTALCVASMHCQIQAVKLLIEHGACVDQEDDDEVTPLERVGQKCDAASAPIMETVQCLTGHGASWRPESFKNALFHRNFPIVEVLHRNGIRAPLLEVCPIIRSIWPRCDAYAKARLWNTVARIFDLDQHFQNLLQQYIMSPWDPAEGMDVNHFKVGRWDGFTE